MTTAGSALEAAVFDMDGLLVDSEPLWRRAEIDVFGRYGVALSEELCRSTKGMFVEEVARHWHTRFPWDGPPPEAVAGEVVDAVAHLLAEEAGLLPGVEHALGFCRQRVQALALASSSPLRLIDVVLRRFELRDVFDVVRSAEFEPAGKPDPAIFLSTASALGARAGRCVVFEDAPAGVRAARAAGMRCVAVPERHAGSSPPAAGAFPAGFEEADVVLGSLHDLDEVAWRAVAGRVAAPPA